SDVCADFVAQVLVFGLLYAHRSAHVTGSTPDERRALIEGFWDTGGATTEAARLRPFKALIDLLGTELGGDSDVAAWYQESARVLAHAECVGTVTQPDYHVLFEHFLEAFDPQVRFDRGAFYTPRPLVTYMTRVAEHLAHEFFAGSLYSIADKLVDPCC